MFDQVWMVRGLMGGVLIGLSASLLLLMNGRVLGITGIMNTLMTRSEPSETRWRWVFLISILLGGLLALWVIPNPAHEGMPGAPVAIIAGLIVGAGTRLGNGCTSGHGVCGLSRLSTRSLVATLTFIFTGAVTVFVTRLFGGAA